MSSKIMKPIFKKTCPVVKTTSKKMWLFSTTRTIPYLLLLLVLAGGFGFKNNVNAQAQAPAPADNAPGFCNSTSSEGVRIVGLPSNYGACKGVGEKWFATEAEAKGNPGPSGVGGTVGASTEAKTALALEIEKKSCVNFTNIDLGGCFLKMFYIVFYNITSFFLWVAAYFFNVLISLTLSSDLTKGSAFIPLAWAAVRDICNIFFILILIYVAIEIILGMSHDGKKTIVKILIMAMLINFSMFFTKIIIDTSNVIALIFYNKISVQPLGEDKLPLKNADGEDATNYESAQGEKDVAGGIYRNFDITKILDKPFLDKMKSLPLPGVPPDPANEVPTSILLGLTAIAGLIMAYTAFCLIKVAVLFLSRLIELWILLVFSPFAFMSSSLPFLSKREGIGWDEWFDRLLSVSFMAPVFMFFLYLIFLILSKNPFGYLKDQNGGVIETLLMILIPAFVILIILKKATEKAEKQAGELGGAVLGLGKQALGLVAGLAIGGGIGLAAKGLQGSAGAAGKGLFENKRLTDMSEKGNWAQRKFAGGLRNIGGGLDGKGGMAGSSFDLRKGVAGLALGTISKATGVNLGHDSKIFSEEGGHVADLERKAEKIKKRNAGLAIKEGEPEKQELNKYEREQAQLDFENHGEIAKLESDIKGAEGKVARMRDIANASKSMGKDAEGNYLDSEHDEKQKDYIDASNKVQKLYTEKSTINNGGYNKEKGKYRTHNGNLSEEEYNATIEGKAVLDKELKTAEEGKEKTATLHTKAVDEESVAEKELADAREVKKRAEGKALLGIAGDKGLAQAVIDATKVETEAGIKILKAKKKSEQMLQNMTNANTKYTETESKAKIISGKADQVEQVKREIEAKGETLGRSKNGLSDKYIPHQKHKIEEVTRGRQWAHADNLEKSFFTLPWNKTEVSKSVHEIRMGAKPKSHSDSRQSHGPGFVEHALLGLAIEHGGNKSKADPASATAGGGGGGHH